MLIELSFMLFKSGEPLLLVSLLSATLLVCVRNSELCLTKVSRYKIALQTDAAEFGGHNRLDPNCEYSVDSQPWHDRPFSVLVSLSTLLSCLLRTESGGECVVPSPHPSFPLVSVCSRYSYNPRVRTDIF